MGAYIDAAKLSAYVSAAVVVQSADDDNDGAADDAALEACINAGEAVVDATLRGEYVLPLITPIDPFVVRLALKASRLELLDRNPERLRLAIDDLRKDFDAELKRLRDADVQIGHPRIGEAGQGTSDGGGAPDALSDPPRGYNAVLGEGARWCR